jgi:hypothetical protein
MLLTIFLFLALMSSTSCCCCVEGFAVLHVVDVAHHFSIVPAASSSSNLGRRRRQHPAAGQQQQQHYYFSSSSSSTSCLPMAANKEDDTNNDNNAENNQSPKKKKRRVKPFNTTSVMSSLSKETDFAQRVTRLEKIVSRQEVQIQKLRKECIDLTEAAVAFARVVDLLRQAGLDTTTPEEEKVVVPDNAAETKDNDGQETVATTTTTEQRNYEYFDDTEIFGRAPSSVIDAADAAGAAILAGMLGGKQRMLVDVRDAELSRDPEILMQFVELSILPVAAGLEGLRSTRNRIKIVFPTVSQLLQYRRTMVLAAPEVVALSTLGFEPIEKQDKLVLLIAPSPDDEEGLAAMNELLCPTDPTVEQISQPLVVVNHHMIPVSGPATDFEVAYHLRLLSVQYMSGENELQYLEAYEEHKRILKEEAISTTGDDDDDADYNDDLIPPDNIIEDDDDALEAAMKHAHEIGTNQGVTRAMVIRSYPK